MHRFQIRRRATDIVLDLLFVTWVSYVLVSGRVLPSQFVELFYNPAPITVVHEPGDQSPQSSPSNIVLDADAGA